MKIMIDISEEDYEIIKKCKTVSYNKVASRLYEATLTGIRLPETIKEIVDRQKVIDEIEFYKINPQHFSFEELINDIKNLDSV